MEKCSVCGRDTYLITSTCSCNKNTYNYCATCYGSLNNIYSSEYFNWKKMLNDIGKDRIKKYLFEVE